MTTLLKKPCAGQLLVNYLNELTRRQQQEESAEEHELLLHQLALEHDEDMLEEPEKGLDYFIINRIR